MVQNKTLPFIVAVLVMCISFSSCDSLRKKFTRQKKKGQTESQEFVPVLEPQDYPAPENNPVEMYKQHYDIIKAWYTDLWTALGESGVEKKIKYTLKQIYGHIEEMQKLVNTDKQIDLGRLKEDLKYYEQSLDENESVRNKSRIQSDLRDFDRRLRRLNITKVKDSLVRIAK